MQLAPQENHQKEGGPLGAHFVLRPVGTAVRGPSPCGQPLFGVDYSDPETAVLGVAFHSLEWLFVRVAPPLFLAALVGIFLHL